MSINKFFEATLGAYLTNKRWSWGAENPDTNQLFLRVWKHEIHTADDLERITLLKEEGPVKKKSAGYKERKRHVEFLRQGAEGFGVVCTAKDVQSEKREIDSFDRDMLLKFGEIITDDDSMTHAYIVDRVPVEQVISQQTASSTLLPDLKSILNHRLDDKPTMKEQLAQARIGQGLFRAQVLKLWNNRCCITGASTLEAIRASHIKPWRHCNNDERLDPYNGLPLVATHDALFDAGLISFADDRSLLISDRISDTERQYLGLQNGRLARKPDDCTLRYLAHHREQILR